MPFFPKVMEFAVVSLDGVPVDPALAGKIRITDRGDAPASMTIKRCDELEWVEPTSADVDWLIKVMSQYSGK